jgi:hypothetical protein
MTMPVQAENKAIVKSSELLNRAYIHHLYQQIEFDTFDRLNPTALLLKPKGNFCFGWKVVIAASFVFGSE